MTSLLSADYLVSSVFFIIMNVRAVSFPGWSFNWFEWHFRYLRITSNIWEWFGIFANHFEYEFFRQQDNSTLEWTSDYDSVDLCMDIFGYTFFMSLAFAFIPQGIISYFAYTSRNNQLGKFQLNFGPTSVKTEIHWSSRKSLERKSKEIYSEEIQQKTSRETFIQKTMKRVTNIFGGKTSDDTNSFRSSGKSKVLIILEARKNSQIWSFKSANSQSSCGFSDHEMTTWVTKMTALCELTVTFVLQTKS